MLTNGQQTGSRVNTAEEKDAAQRSQSDANDVKYRRAHSLALQRGFRFA